ncbi:MAG: DUF3604 domain-containing protein [Anaerolineae bacterium]
MDYPFFGPGGRRAIEPEILSLIAERLGAAPALGFAELIDQGDARTAHGASMRRISGFAERNDLREWLLRVSDKRGLVWRTAPVPGGSRKRVAFLLSVGFGNGSPLPQPSGRWDVFVNDRFAVSIRVVNHSQVWENGEAAFAFSANRLESAPPYGSLTLSTLIEDEAFATFGPALLVVPAAWTEAGSGAFIRVEPRGEYPSRRWFQLDVNPALVVGTDLIRSVDLLTTERHPKVGGYTVYFGDIHTHSGQVLDACENQGCGMGSRHANYTYARGAGGLDFYALTDHEWQVDPDDIGGYLGLADEYNEDGRFVCLPGFEHTSLLYGHRNVYFRGPGGTVVNANRAWGQPSLDPAKAVTPQELWDALTEAGVPFVTVPHHPSATSHPLNLDFYNPAYDRLYEVYSSWGSSEYYGDFPRGVSDRYRSSTLRDALRRNQRYGVVASADGHDGHPGNAQSPMVKHHHIFHHCGSGRAAVLSQAFTREAIFDALYARRCYATTGPPIVLDVSLSASAGTLGTPAMVGEEVPSLADGVRPRLAVACVGSNGLDHLRIVKNGRIVHTEPCHGEFETSFAWEDSAYRPEMPASYYVRIVQIDRESAWSSPIWVG